MLIVKSAVDLRGGTWAEHPLASPPTAIQVNSKSGQPTFLYGSASERIVAYTLERGRRVVETVIDRTTITVTAYGETGRVLGKSRSPLGDPSCN